MSGLTRERRTPLWYTAGLLLLALLAFSIYHHIISLNQENSFYTVIAIDIGNTHARVAYTNSSGILKILRDENGRDAIPPYISFTNKGPIVGYYSRDTATRTPIQVIPYMKELVGLDWTEVASRDLIPKEPFQVGRVGNQMAMISGHGNEAQTLTPEAAAGLIISKLKQMAENELKTKVDGVVITVPANYTDVQRQAIRSAAEEAGLSIYRFVKEPVAALAAYSLWAYEGYREYEDDRKDVVIDIGGHSAEVSVISTDCKFEILASTTTKVGGEDFTQRLTDHFRNIGEEAHGTGVMSNETLLRNLQAECDKAKETLSSMTETRVEVYDPAIGTVVSDSITRAKFNELTSDLIRKLMGTIEQVMKDVNLETYDIDGIILAGGSSQIPEIQRAIREHFDKEPFYEYGDAAVVRGAAIFAGTSINPGGIPVCGIVMDFNKFDLGVETSGGWMQPVIPALSWIPTRKTRLFTTSVDGQSSLIISVIGGNCASAKDNILLGTMVLDGIAPATAGTPRIEVAMDLDPNNILQVCATDLDTGNSVKKNFGDAELGHISEEEEERISCDTDPARQTKESARNRLYVESQLRGYMSALEQWLEKNGKENRKKQPGQMERVDGALRETRQWVHLHARQATERELTAKLGHLRQQDDEFEFEPILSVDGPATDYREDHDEL